MKQESSIGYLQKIIEKLEKNDKVILRELTKLKKSLEES